MQIIFNKQIEPHNKAEKEKPPVYLKHGDKIIIDGKEYGTVIDGRIVPKEKEGLVFDVWEK